MDPNRLRRIFEAALKTSLLSSPLWLGSCGVLQPLFPGRIATDDLTRVCDPGAMVSDLSSPVIPDLIQLRSTSEFRDPEQGPSILASFGTACQTAADAEACLAALEALDPAEGFRNECLQLCVSHYLATTRGDEVEAIVTKERLRAFLGTVDSGNEASLLVFADGFDFTCNDRSFTGFRRVREGVFQVVAESGYACGEGTAVRRHLFEVTANGDVSELDSEVIEHGEKNCVIGRRPEGLVRMGAMDCELPLARYFASAAQLEEASVEAFPHLGRELTAWGAPSALIDAAGISAADEVRHTELTWQLAKTHGAERVTPEVQKTSVRPLLEVALENRVEGCVRETYGALVAHHQALHAADPTIRTMMKGIAADETRHASLSWQVDAWAREQLDERGREVLETAQAQAIATLRAEVSRSLHEAVHESAGMPRPDVALALMNHLERELWN